MKIIMDSERDDFKNLLQTMGRQENDFILKEERDPLVGATIQYTTGSVTITSNKNQKSKKYSAGQGTSWVLNFRNDLSLGLFD